MSQMDIKCTTCDIRIWVEKETFISRHILHQHWNNCPIALPVRRNPQHKNLFSVASATSAPDRASSATFECHSLLDPVVNLFTRQTFPILNRKHFFMNILCIESFCPQKTQNRTLLFGNRLLKHGRHFDYWNKPLTIRMPIFYLDRYEAGLCWYLVVHIHVENLLRPLQLFYFHLWPIYWLSLVINELHSRCA
jgi:hypothetical protein